MDTSDSMYIEHTGNGEKHTTTEKRMNKCTIVKNYVIHTKRVSTRLKTEAIEWKKDWPKVGKELVNKKENTNDIEIWKSIPPVGWQTWYEKENEMSFSTIQTEKDEKLNTWSG